MLRLSTLLVALGIVLLLGILTHATSLNLLPSIPRAHAASVSMVLTGCAFVTGSCRAAGWNGTTTRPNPTITVQQGDVVSVTWSTADTLWHQSLVDAHVDGSPDVADWPTTDPCSKMVC